MRGRCGIEYNSHAALRLPSLRLAARLTCYERPLIEHARHLHCGLLPPQLNEACGARSARACCSSATSDFRLAFWALRRAISASMAAASPDRSSFTTACNLRAGFQRSCNRCGGWRLVMMPSCAQ